MGNLTRSLFTDHAVRRVYTNVHNIKATQKSMLFTVNMTVKFCLQAWNAVMTVIT